MEQKEESSATDFTVVLQKIQSRERHHGAFFYAHDLIQQDENTYAPYQCQLIQRKDSETTALLFHAPQTQPLLEHECIEEHLTLDEWFIKWDAVVAAAHYRGLFQYGLQTLKIGVYFGQNGTEIHTRITLLEGERETLFPKDSPSFINIKEAIKAHWLPFQTLFLDIIKSKTQAISELSLQTLQTDAQITDHLVTGSHDGTMHTQLIQDIEDLILDIKKLNRYDDETQDLRFLQYEKFLSVLKAPDSSPEQHPIPVEISQANIEPQANTSSQALVSTQRPIKRVRQQTQTLINRMVDDILHHLSIADMLSRPNYEQFIHVMKKLEELELECWCLLFNTDPRNASFIEEQKERLGFAALSIDSYFSIQIELGHIAALEALLPLMPQSKKLGHYGTLLRAIVDDKTGQNSILLCQAARFLDRTDPYFNQILKFRCEFLISYKRERADVTLLESVLVTLYNRNNLEGFRLFLEHYSSLQDTQLVVNNVQYHILEACIILYNDASKLPYIRALFEHGMQVDLACKPLSFKNIKQINKKHPKTRHASIGSMTLDETMRISRENINDSLDFTISCRPNELELITEIAMHAPIELLLFRLARSLSTTSFNLRIAVTNTPIFGKVSNQIECESTLASYAPEQGNTSVTCLFYGNNSQEQKTEYKQESAIIDTLCDACKTVVATANIEQMRDITNNLILRAKEAQKLPDKQYIALTLIHAGLFAWTQFPDHVVLEDLELVLRLLCLRGLIASRVYRTSADEVAYITYKVGVLYVTGAPEPLSLLLQNTASFKLLYKAYQNAEARILSRTESGLFGATTPDSSSTLRVPVAEATPGCRQINS